MLSGYLSPDGTFYNAPSYSHMSIVVPADDDFCSYGKRKEDADNDTTKEIN